MDQVRDAEASVTNRMVDGSIDHQRLRATLAEIDADAYAPQLAQVRRSLAGQQGLPLRDGLISSLSVAVSAAGIPVAMVQIIVLAFYRSTWRRMHRMDPGITLETIRSSEVWRSLAIMDGFSFGQHGRMPVAQPSVRSCVERVRRTLLRVAATTGWEGPVLPDGPAIVTRDTSEELATTALRNGFFRSVFIDYIAIDGDRHDHGLVIDVLEQALEHPESMPFLRGCSPAQQAFRIALLARTLVVMHDIACRLSMNDARIATQLRQAPITVQAAALSKDGIGATADFDHLLVECLYARFPTLVAWVRRTGPRLRIPRVVSAASSAAGDTPTTPRTVGPAAGDSPFGWEPSPESRSFVRQAAAVVAPRATVRPARTMPSPTLTGIDKSKAETEFACMEI